VPEAIPRVGETILAHMAADHHHECIDCGDVWLCVSECLPLRLTLCGGCAEKRQQSRDTSPDRVIGLTPVAWGRMVAPHLLAETGEALRRRLRRRGDTH
jgi:hypothetical protein